MADDDKSEGKAKGKGKKDKEKGGGGKKMTIIILVVGLAGGFFVSKMMGGGGSATAGPTTTAPPVPGETAVIEAININLADGHFLRISVGVQLSKTVTVKPEAWSKTESAKVNDLVVSVFSGRKMEELETKQGREEALKELTEAAKERGEGDIVTIYLNEFVMQ